MSSLRNALYVRQLLPKTTRTHTQRHLSRLRQQTCNATNSEAVAAGSSYPAYMKLKLSQCASAICVIKSYSNEAPQQLDAATNLDSATYERVCAETLDALSDYFDELTENATDLHGSDVSYGDGVLTVKLGKSFGTYVINRQTPNKQIWLSSPTSGPKRFDFMGSTTGAHGKWIYRHTGESLHDLLQMEIANIIKHPPVKFIDLPYGS